MAIEIREVVVKATVNKTVGSSNQHFVTKAELQKFQDKFLAKIMGRVRDLIEEERSFR
jgi:hypothetical protein